MDKFKGMKNLFLCYMEGILSKYILLIATNWGSQVS